MVGDLCSSCDSQVTFFVSGYFLRRLIVNFEKLTFSEVTSVYLTFKKYYEEWQKTLNSHNEIAVEVNKVMCPDDW